MGRGRTLPPGLVGPGAHSLPLRPTLPNWSVLTPKHTELPALAWPVPLESVSAVSSPPGARDPSKHMAASACIVCFMFLYLHLYIYNFIKKRKNHFDPFLGQGYGYGCREGVRKGVGQLA